MLYINCHTSNYADHAKKLVESLEAFALPYEVEEFDSLGSWEANCQYKAEFIYEKWLEHGQVVWLDADCMVKRQPGLFASIPSDVAFHLFKGKELLSGTLFFNDTIGAEQILKAWIKKNKEKPGVWDQKNLAEVIRNLDVDISYLPPEYCYIFDLSKLHYPNTHPVIEHYQASRGQK
jgi:hypothetical protein